ncbi:MULTISPECIES: hypothetical protein [unclassified Paenibacillus]|uniref:hypothetical protein n=1 Tax=unclassified Paenibacillus TaxID=185978 RepID=UPI00020D7BB4|nr:MULTISPECIES: hypothetical protein [unclassified Paenibacillus]EGL18573.1 hypothetical protein HMPREF9413_5926 [Paenibacillus sp. HGF7]EPD80510.1 hypothetical protein HMPREF1207_05616 [Paenibacillus sp. HGH0039]
MLTDKEKQLWENKFNKTVQRFKVDVKVTVAHPVTGEIFEQESYAILDELALGELKDNIENSPFRIINVSESDETENSLFFSVPMELTPEEKELEERLISTLQHCKTQTDAYFAFHEDEVNYEGFYPGPVPTDFQDNVKIYSEVCVCHPQASPKIKYIAEIKNEFSFEDETIIDIWDVNNYYENNS